MNRRILHADHDGPHVCAVTWLARAMVALVCLVAAMPRNALARQVRIRWDKVDNAARYELEIRQGDRTVLKEEIPAERPQWKGRLKAGLYRYIVRAIDRVERPGEWTRPEELVVAPRPPSIKLPVARESVVLETMLNRMLFVWDAPDPTAQYTLELERDGIALPPVSVAAPEWTMPDPEPGQYRWRVTAVAVTEGRRTPGEPSPWSRFSLGIDASYLIALHKFPPPEITWPPAAVAPTADGQIALEWRPVPGADRYEVRVEEAPTGGRSPASTRPRVFVTGTTSVPILVGAKRSYTWTVRALAHVDDQGRPAVASSTSRAQFLVDPNAVDRTRPPTRLTFVSGVAGYDMAVTSPSANVVGAPQGQLLSTTVSAETWLSARWGLTGSLHVGFLQFSRKPILPVDLAAQPAVRFVLGDGSLPWVLEARAGLAAREHFAPLPISFGTDTRYVTFATFGPAIDFAVDKALSQTLAVRLSIGQYLPVALLGLPGWSLRESHLNDNRRAELQARYALSQASGLIGAIGVDGRHVTYALPGAPASEDLRLHWMRIGGGLYVNW